ncbi:LysE family transporter [Ferrovibrio sp.]|uniref:LysE family translocator n=1 Tax=Ferrovibrio sp. TaxID=1917215 RepID=UPI002614FBD5|nr:LysE family transporter [Ferrovibrio sp.]
MSGHLELLLRGILLGLAVAAPVGPIGVLCIQRSLQGGFWAGFSGGIGTAVADAIYAALAAAGFAALAGQLGPAETALRLGGAAFIAWLGWRTIMSAPAAAAADAPMSGRPWRLFAVTFALTMGNPATILSFAALFAGLGLAAEPGLDAAAIAVAGVFVGSLLWWAVLSGSVAALRYRISDDSRRWINRIAGIVLIAFAIALAL